MFSEVFSVQLNSCLVCGSVSKHTSFFSFMLSYYKYHCVIRHCTSVVQEVIILILASLRFRLQTISDYSEFSLLDNFLKLLVKYEVRTASRRFKPLVRTMNHKNL